MNRDEFLRELEALLYDISPAERENALEYYRDYFADAGPENEAIVIRELGSPARVAQTIRDGLYGEPDAGGFTERGYRDQRNDTMQAPAGGAGQSSDTRSQNDGKSTGRADEKPNKKTSWDVSKIILVVILCILLAAPVGGLLLGAGGTILGLVIAFFAVIFSVAVTVIALMVAGIATGVGMIFASFFMIGSPGNALLTAGTGFLALALGILCLILSAWVCGSLLPAIFNGIGKLFRKLFSGGGARA